MKSILYLLILLLIFTSCEKNPKLRIDSKAEIKEKPFIPVYGEKYFKYDQIDFYHIDFDENKIIELDNNQDKSKVDKLKNDIITGEFPENINQTDFLKLMDKIGYSKKEISKSKFAEIDKIFIEKTVEESYANACIVVYRDILVFKSKGKIIGIAKICFGCHQHRIIGTDLNNDNFGQNGDYEKLETLLNQ